MASIDPAELLFSLPTIESTLPPLDPSDGARGVWLEPDDWRQHEFVARRFTDDIEAELRAIRAVWAERTGVGFPRCHVRDSLPRPLAGTGLTLAEIEGALGASERGGVLLGGNLVAGGFAFPAGDGTLYGRAAEGWVEVLALNGDADLARLRALATKHELLLVDWVRAAIE